MRLSFQILLLGALLLAGMLILIRVAPLRADRWHIDPEQAPRPSSPNFHMRRDVDGTEPAHIFSASFDETAAALDRVIMARPNTRRLAGAASDGLVTYVERSRFLGFPDVISLRLTDMGLETRVSVFSKSRYGRSDLGVNRRRVSQILRRVEAALQSASP